MEYYSVVLHSYNEILLNNIMESTVDMQTKDKYQKLYTKQNKPDINITYTI